MGAEPLAFCDAGRRTQVPPDQELLVSGRECRGTRTLFLAGRPFVQQHEAGQRIADRPGDVEQISNACTVAEQCLARRNHAD